jgi:hypothetical protein
LWRVAVFFGLNAAGRARGDWFYSGQ